MKLVKLNPTWSRMLQATLNQGHASTDTVVYALDPGETTGRCIYNVHNHTVELVQLETKEVVPGWGAIKEDILSCPVKPDVIVCEDYRVYGHKADDHKWAGLHTPQLIGAIKVLAFQLCIPLHFQMAIQAKQFVTDQLLEQWSGYERGMKHARDAERHALYYKLFGTRDKKNPQVLRSPV